MRHSKACFGPTVVCTSKKHWPHPLFAPLIDEYRAQCCMRLSTKQILYPPVVCAPQRSTLSTSVVCVPQRSVLSRNVVCWTVLNSMWTRKAVEMSRLSMLSTVVINRFRGTHLLPPLPIGLIQHTYECAIRKINNIIMLLCRDISALTIHPPSPTLPQSPNSTLLICSWYEIIVVSGIRRDNELDNMGIAWDSQHDQRT